MVKCDECGEATGMPYECSYCGRKLCKNHRLPENHECDGDTKDLKHPNTTPDSSSDDGGLRDKIADAKDKATGKRKSSGRQVQRDSMTLTPKSSSPLAVIRRNMTYVFLALMWATFLTQVLVDPFISDSTARAIFTLSTEHPEYVWTWVTSIFAHGGFLHIIGNSFVVFFFGRLVEKRLGTRRYIAFFIGTGVVAGLGQVVAGLALGQTVAVLGASGAGLAILGFVTVLNPSLPVVLFPIPLPVPVWVLTTFYAGFSLLSVTAGGIGAGGVAQVTHLVGLAIGLAYGRYLEEEVRSPNRVELSR